MVTKKKLIEVALPLQAINEASAREKSIRHGHPSTLHLWWARRPLAAARAVIFAQMVDDPSSHPDLFPTEKAQEKERQRLFRIIEELVKWENTTNEKVLQQARDEIWQSWRYTCAENADHPRASELFNRQKLPAFHDPFAGGGTLPLEAQRLGLEAYASDLNPVAVLINKAMIEIPPKFAGRPPVNPEAQRTAGLITWKGAQGLAEDVRYYGQWMRDEAEKRIGHLYPKVEITEEMVRERPDLKPYLGQKLTVIAWLWARTVKSPNPAFSHVDVPLISTYVLSANSGEEAYLEPVINGDAYHFKIKLGNPKNIEAVKKGTKLERANFYCLMSGAPITGEYIKTEGKAGRIGARLMAIIAAGDRRKVYLSSSLVLETLARQAKPYWKPDLIISGSTQYLGIKPYGMENFSQLFTDRQIVALTTLSELVQELCTVIKRHAVAAGLSGDQISETSASAYTAAIQTYLAFAISKCADYWNTSTTWMPRGTVGHLFARQAIQMTWDYPEANPFSDFHCAWHETYGWVSKAIETLPSSRYGHALQADAASQILSENKVISTDPPYYDNVPYADISDFFYVWLRRSLKSFIPSLFETLAVPKANELVAFAYRHLDGKVGADEFFLKGMTQAMHSIAKQALPTFPVTIYYAFKQSESDSKEENASTGWETFLEAVIRAGFAITGTWPVRTEREVRSRGIGSNALASSIILVCRLRTSDSLVTTRRDFVAALKTELPIALAHLQRSNIAPVDLAQAAIGPGMAIFTRYSKVLDAKGNPMSVREALALINQTLDEVLAEQEGDFDADSRWALAWFEQSGFSEGEYGVAETLSKAKNTSVAGMVEAGILVSKAGKVRLLQPNELPADWDPEKDVRLTAWEMVHQLIRVLEKDGEHAAAGLAARLGANAEIARELCYRLYTLCERKKRASLALSYNALVQSWPEIMRLAKEGGKRTTQQAQLFDEE